MKRIFLSLLLAVITVTAFSQSGEITVIVASSEPATGLTSIDYEFTGIQGRTYTLTVEVNFDDGVGSQPIPEADLSGDISGISGDGTAFSGTIVWDGAASFPDRYHEQTRIRITAELVLSENEVVDIDGNFYSTVIIGDQEWMAENLRVTRYKNGDAIPTGLSDTDWGSTTEGAYAIYPYGDIDGLNSNEGVHETYGKLYNWYAVDDPKGLCPAGWFAPSDDDWKALEMHLGMSQAEADEVGFRVTDESRKLKSERTAIGATSVAITTNDHPRWDYHAINFGTDDYGFSALPGGERWGGDGMFYSVGRLGFFWTSSTGDSSTAAWRRHMSNSSSTVGRHEIDKVDGYSVRCVRDIE